MFSYSRDRSKLEAIASEAGGNAQVGSLSEAAEFGEVVLFVVPWKSVSDALAQGLCRRNLLEMDDLYHSYCSMQQFQRWIQ
jgi:predicted dinucleotide-binding enzyme